MSCTCINPNKGSIGGVEVPLDVKYSYLKIFGSIHSQNVDIRTPQLFFTTYIRQIIQITQRMVSTMFPAL